MITNPAGSQVPPCPSVQLEPLRYPGACLNTRDEAWMGSRGASSVTTIHALSDREGRRGGLERPAMTEVCGYAIPQFHQGPIQSSGLQDRLFLPWARVSSLPSISRSMCEAILPPLCSCSSLFLNTSIKWVWVETALPTCIKAIHSSVSHNFLLLFTA